VLRAALAASSLAFAASAQTPAPPPGAALTLERATQIALERNYDQLRAQYQALSSEQDLVIARSAILPLLDFNGSLQRVRQGAGTPIVGGVLLTPRPTEAFWAYRGDLTASQLLFDGGKWWNNLAAAGAQLASTQASIDEQRLTTVYTVEQRFYELVRAQRQLKVLGDAAQRSRDQAGFTQRLFEGGRATQADVYAARANRDNDEIVRLTQERVVEFARQDLALTIGWDPAQALAILEPQQMQQEPQAPPPAGQAVEKALASRPSLKAFAYAAESRRKSEAAARGDYWPRVGLSASFGRSTTDWQLFTGLPLGHDSTISGGVDVTWNLFAGFSTKANVEKAQVNVLLAENDLINGRRGVASDVERAVAQLGTAKQQALIATQSEQTAGENLRLARTRQQVGVGTQLEVRDAELKLTQAQLARDNALVDGHEAESALRRAVGG